MAVTSMTAISQLIKVLPLIVVAGSGGVWVSNTFITKSDLSLTTNAMTEIVEQVETKMLVAVNEGRLAQVRSDLWAMERVGEINFDAAEKRRYEILKLSEVDIAKQRQKLLGLD